MSGKYLCCDCGKTFQKAALAQTHELNEHLPDDDFLEEVSEDDLEERWLLLYNDLGRDWEHPKEIEGKKKLIARVLSDASYFLDEREIRQKTGFTKTEIHRLLDELVEEDRIEQEQHTWGAPA